VPAFAPEISEATKIPANVGLSVSDRNARADAIFHPFHNAVTAFLDERQRRGRTTLLTTIHSFTPVFLGKSRPWEIGVLFNRDKMLSPAIAEWRKRAVHGRRRYRLRHPGPRRKAWAAMRGV
jgi:predicted N-formylglutamate amidohydrolase